MRELNIKASNFNKYNIELARSEGLLHFTSGRGGGGCDLHSGLGRPWSILETQCN